MPSHKAKRRAPKLWEQLKPLARDMRHRPTPGERVLWERLRNRQMCGVKFRRQHAISRYIVDFYAPQARLVNVLLVETHLEREHPARPFWLGYQPSPRQEPSDQSLSDLWQWYQSRRPVEPSIRFRKQYLHWTLPRFQQPEYCDRWTMLVSLEQWQLLLSRELVRDTPLPWQPPQEKPTPERVLQTSVVFSDRLAPQLSLPKRAETPWAGHLDAHARARNGTPWSKRPKRNPKNPESGLKLTC